MKKYNSITNSMRHVCLIDKTLLRKKNSVTKLFWNKKIKNFSGRNNTGSISVYSKGTRKKRLFRIIDYKRNILNIPGIIYSNEYDPNRSSFISLVVYKNFICCYILGIQNLDIGSYIYNYNSNFKKNSLFYKKGDKNILLYLSTGSIIHNLEYLPNNGSIYIRSAGTYGKIIKKYLRFNKALIQLPSGYTLYSSIYSSATLGIVSNPLHNKVSLGKAGRNRWLGKKSSVRGVAMNPVDHPHGGGEGKKSAPSFKRSPWGKISKWKNKKKIKKFHLI